MRLITVFAVAAAFAGVPFAAGEDKKTPPRPALDSKEWKKQKSGLEIWDVKEGKGDAVTINDEVTVHYTGWLTDKDATVFDSSVTDNEPITFKLKGLIKGWQEGIQGMKPGGVRRLKVPAELAYGNKKVGPIPANSELIFEIELLKVKVPPSAKLARPKLDAKEWKKQKSGLEIWDVKEGKGEPAKADSTVVIHYTGWLTDDAGTVFDSSLDRDKKAEFPLESLIKGWQEGIPGMKPGGVRRLKIPADLAYGEKGRPGIPGGSTLVFEIELFEAK
jgi:FKBP-type peptidyl-prolyl cis-trans isomerase